MKEINDQLYGLEAELDTTSEDNGTTCFCVDKGTVFVAYGGIWYEQRNVYWKVGGAAESDLSGYSRYMPSAAAMDDLACFNAVDTGERFVAFSGHWFKQPVPWADDSLLKAAQAGGGSGGAGFIVVHYSLDGNVDDGLTITIEEDWDDIAAVGEAGGLIIAQGADKAYFAHYYPAGEEDGETFPAGIYWVEQFFAGFGEDMTFLDATCSYASTGESYYEEQHWYVETYDPTNP